MNSRDKRPRYQVRKIITEYPLQCMKIQFEGIHDENFDVSTNTEYSKTLRCAQLQEMQCKNVEAGKKTVKYAKIVHCKYENSFKVLRLLSTVCMNFEKSKI